MFCDSDSESYMPSLYLLAECVATRYLLFTSSVVARAIYFFGSAAVGLWDSGRDGNAEWRDTFQVSHGSKTFNLEFASVWKVETWG